MREVELKFAVDRTARERLAAAAPLARARPERRPLTTLYFDTADGELRSRGMALRLRREEGRWVQSLKAGASGVGGLHARDEWEFDRATPGLELALFAETPLAGVADPERLHERLAVAFAVNLVRTAWVVSPTAGNRLEVVLDEGEVRRGARAERIREVEIECLEGDARAAFDLADALLDALPMRPSLVTKAQRGYRLIDGKPLAPAKAKPVALSRAMSTLDAARAIAGAALGQLEANEEGVAASDDPEFVHQARVALRRLRSALRMFRAAAGRERSRVWRDELASVAAALGVARDWDVFALEMLPPALAAHGNAALSRRLRARAARERERHQAAARKAVASARHARAVLALSRWLSGVDAEPLPAGPGLADFAERSIRKAHDRLLARARHFAKLDAGGRHRLRIEAKRLRYGVDALAPVLASHHVARYHDTVAKLQDALGAANDAVTASRLLPELDPPVEFLRFARRRFAAQARASFSRAGPLLERLAAHRP